MSTQFGGLLLRLEVVAGELLLELLNAARCVDKGRFAGEERVRARPDIDLEFRNGCADGHDDLAVVVDLAGWVVGWVCIVFHGVNPWVPPVSIRRVAMVGVGGGEVNGEGYNENKPFTANDREAIVKKPKEAHSAFNSYTIGDQVGEGGAGVVYEATDKSDKKKYAIKFLDLKRSTTEKRKRFRNEIGFCSQSVSPYIIKVSDYGTLEDQTPFFVMPLYESSLRVLIGMIDPDGVLEIFDKILSGVDAAHKKMLCIEILSRRIFLFEMLVLNWL